MSISYELRDLIKRILQEVYVKESKDDGKTFLVYNRIVSFWKGDS